MKEEIKEKAEIEYLKTLTYTKINEIINELKSTIESLNEEKEVNIVSDDLRKQISDLVVIAVADSNKLTEVIDKIVELKK